MQADSSSPQEAQILAAIIDVLHALKARTGERENPATVFLLRHLRGTTPMRISDLAEASRLDISTVSRHVKALTEAGHVARVEDPVDRRACLVGITDAGVDLYDRAMSVRAEALSAAVADWPGADRTHLLDLVRRLATSLTHPAETRSTA
ncbi:MAG: winged helix-turn-helix transcriptional regulator [Geodermatophilaceae bacterium]|nr:winged helix-turn-helix transcriptional regulator [Geodermatophilaceae bacterium]